MPNLPSLEELLKAGVHFGHQKSRWHPKMKPFLYGIRQGVHIIDLEKTSVQLKKAMDFVKQVAAGGGMILFTSLKVQAHDIVKQAAMEVNMPYVTGRWLGGVFTNFSIIYKLIQKLDKMEADQKSGDWEKYSKKERLDKEKYLAGLRDLVGGVRGLNKIPQAMFLVGLREGKNALAEAKKVNVPVISIADSNTNPTKVEYPIPANDDAIKSLQLITGLVAQAIKEGQAEALSGKVKEEVK
ncbi:MAG TPA: 30S ribosomal protein S2 [Candidatus Veblenbacteria bacterium]|nr:30S ribosomal protein S2 [Candidatus Veblenbacteria bacterium]